MLPPKLIVFDWDGTLADSVRQIVACKAEVARKHNLTPPTEEVVRGVLGIEFMKALSICFPNANADILAKVALDYHVLMQESRYQATLFEGARETLNLLKKKNIILTIATAKARVELDYALHFLDLEGFFDFTCCSEEFKPKPNPAMLNAIMAYTGISVVNIIMLGDTTTDMMFARNAKISSIAVTFGAHSKIQLSALEPLAFIDHWNQLPGVLNLC
jgi:phosphoglycolate phosphatase